MPLAKLKNTEIYYEKHGQGLPLVFIPGLGSNHTMYYLQKNFFAPKYQVILLDLRGNGQSGKLTVPVKEIINIQCQDVLRLLDYLHIPQAVLLGVSYGGIIAQKFAFLYPERLQGLIIADSFCNTRPSTPTKLLFLLGLYLTCFHCLPPKLLVYLLKKQYVRWPKAQKDIIRLFLEMRKYEASKQRLAMSCLDFTDFLPQINVPALTIVGDHSPMQQQSMKQLAQLLPQASLEILINACDPSNLCQPDIFNKTVLNFLQKNFS